MPDKKRELHYVEALKRAIRDFPEGVVLSEETPDVLVQSPFGTVGIEVTVFHLVEGGDTRPHQERQALKDRIVERAWSLHVEQGGQALYVGVHFASGPLHKASVAPMAEAVAAAVARVAREPGSDGELSVPWQDLPTGIAFIAIHRSINGSDQLWHADAGGWVAQVSPFDIQAVVDRKARMCARARERCTELWLLIVNDQFSRAPQAEIGVAATHAEYVHNFDRLIWLVPHVPKAVAPSSRFAI